jgi:glycosyltransferase involved in cell wall biosynthesis
MSIVDDSSSDKTVSISEEMKKQDSRIQLFQFERNSRTVIARNITLTKTEGNYIGFLDAANL